MCSSAQCCELGKGSLGEPTWQWQVLMWSLVLWRALLWLTSANTFNSDKPKDLAFITSRVYGWSEFSFFILFLIVTKIPCNWGERAASSVSVTYFGICCRAVARSACGVGSFSPISFAFPTVKCYRSLFLSRFSPFLCSWLVFHSRYPFLGTFEKKLSQRHVSCVLLGFYLVLVTAWLLHRKKLLPGPSADSMREHFHRIDIEECVWQIKPTLELFMPWIE